MSSTLLLGDSRELLAAMEPGSIDAAIMDGPYELGFMGKKWDSTGIVYDPEFWALVLRVLKPGAHLVNFCATRTYHRMACAVEDAGFEVRNMMQWMFGSSMPKSLDISKAIDKAAGAEREVVGQGGSNCPDIAAGRPCQCGVRYGQERSQSGATVHSPATAPATPEAQQWDGWGSALKPAHEPIVLARKPLAGTIAETVLEYGTGGLNVDGCRVGDDVVGWGGGAAGGGTWTEENCGLAKGGEARPVAGRWPPNVLLSPETAAKLGDKAAYFPVFDYGDEDRFFYAPKASREEREAGCEHLPGKTGREMHDRSEDSQSVYGSRGTENCIRNTHPTVKPVSLMRWLCRLITPPGGLVLDPFAGSGTTGIAAVSEGFDFIGIELDADHHAIAMARIEHAASVAPTTNRAEYVPPKKKQLGLF